MTSTVLGSSYIISRSLLQPLGLLAAGVAWGAVVGYWWSAKKLQVRAKELSTAAASDAVIGSSSAAIVALSETGTVTYWNAAAERMFGFSATQVIGRECPIVPLDLREEHKELVGRVLRGETIHVTQLVRVCRDGTLLPVSLDAAPIRERDGHISGIVVVLVDMTQCFRSCEAQLKSAEDWQQTFDSVQSVIVILDAQGRVLRLNRPAITLLGGCVDPQGLRLSDFEHKEPWRSIVQLLAAPDLQHLQVFDKERDTTWDVSLIVAGSSAAEQRKIVVARDVTRVVKLQESLQKNEYLMALGSLVAAVAHQVRNPLFSISATLDALEARIGENAAYTRHLTILRESVTRMAKLMHHLLDYSRPYELRKIETSLDRVFAEAVAACRSSAARKGIAIRYEISQRVGLIEADVTHLPEVFQIAVENAIHFSPDGSSIWLRASREDDGSGSWVRCTVEDSGPGFGETADSERIFDPFFSKRPHGIGLGLAVAKRIVELHGGKISAENRTPTGARITVRIPVRQVRTAREAC